MNTNYTYNTIQNRKQEMASAYDCSLTQVFRTRRELIFDHISKTKRELLNKLQADEFPVPTPSRSNNGSNMSISTVYNTDKYNSLQSTDHSDCEMEQIDQFFSHEKNEVNKARSVRIKNYEDDTYDFKNISRQNYEDTTKIRAYINERIALFQKKMPSRCKKELIVNFNYFIQLLIEITPSQAENFKLVRVDALADAMLMIAANKVNMGKTEFLDCLTMETRLIPSRVTEIKKFACHRKLKVVFDDCLTKLGLRI